MQHHIKKMPNRNSKTSKSQIKPISQKKPLVEYRFNASRIRVHYNTATLEWLFAFNKAQRAARPMPTLKIHLKEQHRVEC